MKLRVAALLVAVLPALLAPSATAQASLEHVRFRVMLIEYREAIDHYRSGRAAAALGIIEKRGTIDWQNVVDGILVDLRKQAATDEPRHILDVSPLKNDLAHNVRLARSAAALHMEAAMSAYAHDRKTSRHEFDDHVGLAERLFAFVATQDGRPSAAPRWELVLGLTAAADGRFGWAAEMLKGSCERFPRDGPLQLARGSVHETISTMPASQLAAGSAVIVGEFDVWRNPLHAGRAARDDHRAEARKALQRARALLPDSAEAHVRLARVLLLLGDLDGASQLLGVVVERRVVSGPREAYLARLFLARVRQAQRRLEDAAKLFEDAITVVPSGQTAYVGLAEITRARGDAAASVAVVERMLKAPRSEDDPWAGYRFGQYRVRNDMLSELRDEARQ